MKKSKHPFNKWVRFGLLYIFEGEYGLAVGNDKTGYGVYASKKGVHIHRDGKVTYQDKNGYCGIFQTRKEAAGLVKSFDKSLSKNSRPPVKYKISKPAKGGEKLEAFVQTSQKTGGKILVYEEDDIEGLAHERAHYLAGHLDKGGMPKKRMETTLKEEKEAVKLQIKLLKEQGEYSPRMKKDIIKHLATYCKGKTEKQKIRQAEKLMKELE